MKCLEKGSDSAKFTTITTCLVTNVLTLLLLLLLGLLILHSIVFAVYNFVASATSFVVS